MASNYSRIQNSLKLHRNIENLGCYIDLYELWISEKIIQELKIFDLIACN